MPFESGKSGNPAGRKQGSRHKVTLAAQSLLEGEAENITRKCIELALEGDITAIKLVMERIVPVKKDSPVEFKLPAIKTADKIFKASQAVLKAVSKGELTPNEAQSIVGLLEVHRRSLETVELEKRIEELEEETKAQNNKNIHI
jgi:hypothetical protein